MQAVKFNSDIAISAGVGFDVNQYKNEKILDNLTQIQNEMQIS
jgi:hypothetical protein